MTVLLLSSPSLFTSTLLMTELQSRVLGCSYVKRGWG